MDNNKNTKIHSHKLTKSEFVGLFTVLFVAGFITAYLFTPAVYLNLNDDSDTAHLASSKTPTLSKCEGNLLKFNDVEVFEYTDEKDKTLNEISQIPDYENIREWDSICTRGELGTVQKCYAVQKDPCGLIKNDIPVLDSASWLIVFDCGCEISGSVLGETIVSPMSAPLIGETFTLNPYYPLTYLSQEYLSGTKENNTSLFVNNTVVSDLNNPNVEWSYSLPLEIGLNENEVYGVNASGEQIESLFVNIERCIFGDLNCDDYVNIYDFKWFVKAIHIYRYSDLEGNLQSYYPFMRLADMNNGSNLEGDGANDIFDFTNFKAEYLKYN